MKLRLTLAALVVFGVLVTSVCRRTGTSTAQLEELPKDIAATLQRVPNSDLLVSVQPTATRTPAVVNATAKTAAAAPGVKPLEPNCSSDTDFFIQVYYPVTVCSPIGGLFPVLTAYDEVMSPGPKPPNEVKDYKLSSFQGKSLTASIFCRVRPGPWLATIVKSVDCNSKGSCIMTIGIPSSPYFKWDGDFCQHDRPQGVHYIQPMVQGQITFSPCNTENVCQ